MSIKERKARENAELRQDILGAATRLFADEGYENVSMRKIAALIDYSPTTIYRFFQNKQELLTTIGGATYSELSAKFERVKAKTGSKPRLLLKNLVREYIVFCAERPDMFRLYSDLGSFETKDGVLYERIGETRFKVFQSWFQAIRESIEKGSLRKVGELRVFLYLFDAANGYIHNRVRYNDLPRKPLAQDSAEYVNMLFGGIEAHESGKRGCI